MTKPMKTSEKMQDQGRNRTSWLKLTQVEAERLDTAKMTTNRVKWWNWIV